MKSAIFAVVLLTLGLLSLPVLAQQQDLQDVMKFARAGVIDAPPAATGSPPPPAKSK